MRNISLFRQIITQLLLALVGFFVLLPIWGIARLAFDGALKGRPTEFRLFPKEWSLTAFLNVLDKPYQSVDFAILLRNSVVVSFGAAIIAILLGISLAYAFARFRFPGRQGGLFAILLTAFLPPVAFMTPLYILLSMMQIRTTLWALVIVYSAFAMPFCIWNMRAAFQAIPKEVEEAAFLDGAGDLQTFLHITFPLALPTIAISGLIAFLMAYSEFAIGWLFVDKADTVTLAMSLYAIVQTQYQGGAQPWSYLGSLAIIMSIPVVVIFLIFQNTLLERMLFGTTE
ncbi:MAG TPA: carbohydrate ABC transporter permease [Anaerolineales bacterium]|jgi:arabinogalactan oligomer/maltooligosaccharide transport system permease protein|nr:carbohydrate ABC transporter permease [Anaerolineales bacterium]HNC07947.1 carbohydrate ABC transporter permease [Anaerolineales bacterium]